MVDLSEFDFEKAQESTGAPRARSPVPWVIGAVAVLSVGLVVWFFLSGEPDTEPVDDAPAIAESPPSPREGTVGICQATDAAAVPITLPSLDSSDALVGTLAGTLSSNLQVAAWLATDDLLRNFTAAIENIANGASPSIHLGPLRPDSPFMVIGEGNGLRLDPRSYSRYTPIAAAAQSVDVQAAAQLCATLKPRLDEAFADLGRNESFETTLERAIVQLLSTPTLTGDVRLVRNDETYAFRDVELEHLTPAQKHLVRMGAENTRVIQGKLRQLALAIGIPGDRLPQSPD